MLFLAAGVSDAVDGYLAKRFQMTTELGAYLDPLADKALIVSIYLTLGIKDLIPGWLVILVVSRDIMIVGAVMLLGWSGYPSRSNRCWYPSSTRLRRLYLPALCSARLASVIRSRHSLGAHGPCRHADIAVGCRVCGRMGAPHQFDGVKTLSPRAPSRSRRKPALERSVRAPASVLVGRACAHRPGAVAAQRNTAALCRRPGDCISADAADGPA